MRCDRAIGQLSLQSLLQFQPFRPVSASLVQAFVYDEVGATDPNSWQVARPSPVTKFAPRDEAVPRSSQFYRDERALR